MPCIEYWFLLHFENHTELLKSYTKVANLLAPYMKGCFPPSVAAVRFKKLMKGAKYLEDETWVKNLCDGGKLEDAINRAENNVAVAIANSDLEQKSYTFVYKKLFKFC